jgi:hypothetical protein
MFLGALTLVRLAKPPHVKFSDVAFSTSVSIAWFTGFCSLLPRGRMIP